MCKFVQREIHLKKVGQDFHFFEAHTSSVIIAIMCYTPAPPSHPVEMPYLLYQSRSSPQVIFASSFS